MVCQYHDAIERELKTLHAYAKDNRDQIRMSQKWALGIVGTFLIAVIAQLWILLDVKAKLSGKDAVQIIQPAQAETK